VNLSDNGLLTDLPELECSLLVLACERVELKAGQVLGSRNATPMVYFLTGATVALLVKDEHHASLAVGLLGSAHAVGLEQVLGCHNPTLEHRVQTAGSAWCIPAPVLEALALEHAAILNAISRQLWLLVSHVASFAASIQTLDIQARLAAWLVLSAQTAHSQHLRLTHEHLAHMLGVRRVSITLAAGHLREQGLLSYSRGQVHLLDMPGLVQAALPN
jgi:CRP-like cAMP-binding protein